MTVGRGGGGEGRIALGERRESPSREESSLANEGTLERRSVGSSKKLAGAWSVFISRALTSSQRSQFLITD